MRTSKGNKIRQQTTSKTKNRTPINIFYTPDPTLSLIMSHDDLPAFHGQTLDHLYFDGPCSSETLMVGACPESW
jgi:hypothetical protein